MDHHSLSFELCVAYKLDTLGSVVIFYKLIS